LGSTHSKRGTGIGWLATACVILAGAPARAGVVSGDTRPGDGFWLSAELGVTFATGVTIDRVELDNTPAPDAVVSLAFAYRLGRFDFGVMGGSVGAGRFRSTSGATHPIGGQGRIAVLARWRFVDERWGALFIGLTPGIAFISHSDDVRARTAEVIGQDPSDLAGVDSTSTGFGFGADLGFAIHLTEAVSLFGQVEVLFTTARLQEGSEGVTWNAIQPLFVGGVEARL
jgi:hypothetical protein